MKTKFALICLLTFIAASCGSDDASPYKCGDCIDTPEAVLANDGIGKRNLQGPNSWLERNHKI